jgi:hypothetical protein
MHIRHLILSFIFVSTPMMASDNIVLSALKRHWVPSLTNHFISDDPSESPWNVEGQIYYIPRYSESGTLPIYRLFRQFAPTNHDHMTSVITN